MLSTSCLLSIALSGCVAVPDINLQSRLNTLDFDLDSSSYIVRPGETLETIAFRYSMSVDALRKLNPGMGDSVFPGMDLNVRLQPDIVAANDASRRANNGVAPTAQAVQIAPVQATQAIVIDENTLAALKADQLAMQRGASSARRDLIRATPVYPEIVRSAPDVSTAAYAVEEEVIVDENFQLPTITNRVDKQQTVWVGEWSWPIDGQLARDYDPGRVNGGGIEIVGAPGQNIYATRDGVVNWVGSSPGGAGKMVIVKHSDGFMSIYSNAQELFVATGENVEKGQAIAKLGANANDEPLLRFEISKNGNLLNPNEFLTPR